MTGLQLEDLPIIKFFFLGPKRLHWKNPWRWRFLSTQYGFRNFCTLIDQMCTFVFYHWHVFLLSLVHRGSIVKKVASFDDLCPIIYRINLFPQVHLLPLCLLERLPQTKSSSFWKIHSQQLRNRLTVSFCVFWTEVSRGPCSHFLYIWCTFIHQELLLNPDTWILTALFAHSKHRTPLFSYFWTFEPIFCF